MLGIPFTNSAQQYPEGFNEEQIAQGLLLPGGILHADSARSFLWELNGKVWLLVNDLVHPEPVIDISEEVALWGDHAMIGAALHPDFHSNGYIYLYYVVDRHHLMYFGTDQYDPSFTEDGVAVMGRLTRYTLNTVDFQFAIPGSRKILLGENPGDGLPIPTWSHGVGAVIFGEDGSLLLSTGDGNTWVGGNDGLGYNGTGPVPAFGMDSVALMEGLLRPEEMLGAFRAQYLNGLNGKILRLHPETGEGLPNNPFFDNNNPNAPQSKVYALGLRNPYRMTLKQGTGHGGLNDGFPGIVYIADVGDWVWEEINVLREPGRNFGWPMFQGPVAHNFYKNKPTNNPLATNPLFGFGNCNKEFFLFQETVVADNAGHEHFFTNPCNPAISIPDHIFTFVHERPILAYANEANSNNPYAVYPSFDVDGNESFTHLESNNSTATGQNFQGLSVSGGAFLDGELIPEEYQGLFVFADFSGWIRAARFDDNHGLQSIALWNDNAGRPVFINQNPYNGCLYYTSIFPSFVKKICFGGNLRPVVKVNPPLVYGYSPLEVFFNTIGTYDPEGDPLHFEWDFCGSETSNEPSPTVTLEAPQGEMMNCNITLTVSDNSGGITTVHIPVSLNNTPPEAHIVSIEEGDLYPTEIPSSLQLIAQVSDAEHAPEELTLTWTLLLHHNTHFHRIQQLEGNHVNLQLSPTVCSPFETYWYEIQLEVTDPGGLKATDSRMIYPDCEGTLDVEWPAVDGDYMVYPNPASTSVIIQSRQSLPSSFHYQLIGIDGKKITDAVIPVFHERSFVKIPLSRESSNSAGLFILRFFDGDNWISRKLLLTD